MYGIKQTKRVAVKSCSLAEGILLSASMKVRKYKTLSRKSEYISEMVAWKALSDKIKNFGHFIGGNMEPLKYFEPWNDVPQDVLQRDHSGNNARDKL